MLDMDDIVDFLLGGYLIEAERKSYSLKGLQSGIKEDRHIHKSFASVLETCLISKLLPELQELQEESDDWFRNITIECWFPRL